MEYSLGNDEITKNLSKESVKLLKESIILEDIKKFYLFFSFDLVNSTKFKTRFETKEKWQFVVYRFYEMIFSELRKKSTTNYCMEIFR